MREQGPQELSNFYQYIMYRDILNSEPTITVKNIHKLLELEAKAYEETHQATSLPPSLVLEQWEKESRFLAVQHFIKKTEEAQEQAKAQEISPFKPPLDLEGLTKFWARCTDTLLNAPLFPGHPDRYDKFIAVLEEHEKDSDMDMKLLLQSALAYNEARFGDYPDDTSAQRFRQTYDLIHSKRFPAAHATPQKI